MKKFLVSAFVFITFVIYSLHQRVASNVISPTVSQTPNSGSSSTTTTQPSTSTTGFKDGQYTGDIVDAYYGNVQVKAIISGGKITDIQFLDYPRDRQQSNYINSQATPMLRTEAIQAQSANVDIISGATATSQAFIQSLGSALAKAK